MTAEEKLKELIEEEAFDREIYYGGARGAGGAVLSAADIDLIANLVVER